jgi:hypothetical protein
MLRLHRACLCGSSSCCWMAAFWRCCEPWQQLQRQLDGSSMLCGSQPPIQRRGWRLEACCCPPAAAAAARFVLRPRGCCRPATAGCSWCIGAAAARLPRQNASLCLAGRLASCPHCMLGFVCCRGSCGGGGRIEMLPMALAIIAPPRIPAACAAGEWRWLHGSPLLLSLIHI